MSKHKIYTCTMSFASVYPHYIEEREKEKFLTIATLL